ncbi:gamma-glutamyl hydrolase-like [Daphnia pulex]|uniref:gamma-glutamyl hydrolase-like n=1 Tax=Daphnia pulex TaxID=6669 RepID=UPI001EDE7553|nr:gamma-glutamyl hydrolase-like [Daphnia pulex]
MQNPTRHSILPTLQQSESAAQSVEMSGMCSHFGLAALVLYLLTVDVLANPRSIPVQRTTRLHPNSIRYNVNNNRPIIGILSQEPSKSMASVSPESVSYIAASYVKWLEGQGARVVPIRINQPDSYYKVIFNSINGLLIPGGGSSLITSGYGRAGSILYDLSIEANNNGDFFPVWGTCLGFELLLYLSAAKRNYLTSCESYNRASTLKFLPDASTSHLYQRAPDGVLKTLSKEKSTSNFHHWCMTRENLTMSNLDKFYRPLATSTDDNGLEFVATIEAVNYPIWGVQFHPEKNVYEWGANLTSVPHSPGAVKAGLYFADFFVSQARKSQHRFSSRREEESYLIYNYLPVYTGNVSSSFLQSYFFD